MPRTDRMNRLSLKSSPSHDVVTFGDLCVDLVVSGPDVSPEFGQVEKIVEDYSLEMGGSCSLFACQAARLGLRTGIVGKVGQDSFGDLILCRLREHGVDTHDVRVDPCLKTGLGIALCPPGDRAILTYLGSINAVSPQDITDDFLASSRHLHHASYFLQSQLRPCIPKIFWRARQLGLTISLDTNWDPEDCWGGELKESLSLVDIFMPNEREALRIAGASSLDQAISHLHHLGIPLVVVKRGAEGALVSDGEKVISQAVEPAIGGDSIGAGDSFDAGFLGGWLRGLPIEECLCIGCACGRSVASQVGGLKGQLTWREAMGR